jgi:hypothetical protein
MIMKNIPKEASEADAAGDNLITPLATLLGFTFVVMTWVA